MGYSFYERMESGIFSLCISLLLHHSHLFVTPPLSTCPNDFLSNPLKKMSKMADLIALVLDMLTGGLFTSPIEVRGFYRSRVPPPKTCMHGNKPKKKLKKRFTNYLVKYLCIAF